MPDQLTIACARCGTSIKLYPSQVGRKRFCSRACQRDGRHVTLICVECGKPFDEFANYASRARFCSRECNGRFHGRKQTERATITRICAMCGIEFRTTQHHGGRLTCSTDCGNAAKGRFGHGINQQVRHPRSSGIEERVAVWLTEHGIPFERHIEFGPCVIDFRIGLTLLEVNGCYWHGCELHNTALTAKQVGRRRRDSIVRTETQRAGVRLIEIWEHDIRANDWSALDPLLIHRPLPLIG